MGEDEAMAQGILKGALLIALYLGVSLAVVYVTKGSRRVPVQYARMVRGRGVYGGQKHYMPLKVNQANVMPVIFAMSLLVFPSGALQRGRARLGRTRTGPVLRTSSAGSTTPSTSR